MEGTWGRRVFGSVSRGATHTKFRIDIRLDNGCVFYESKVIANDQLDRYPKFYGWTLNTLTETLDARVKERHQRWLR